MRLMTNFLILAVAGTALAQAPANNKPATPAAKPATTTTTAKPAQAAPAKPAQAAAAKPTTATTTAKPQSAPAKPATATATKPVMPAAKTAAPAAKPAVKADAKKMPPKKVVAKKEAAPAKPAAEENKDKPADAQVAAKNRRDPFVSVVVNREGAPCAGGGKKCIDIATVTLQGVVRAPSGPIAVISSGSNKTYFLRENDPVYNGVVVKISPDSIVFRETVMDRVGKTSQREVVKKIHNAPAA